MSNQINHTKVAIKEKMKRIYGEDVAHKHNKDHLEYREHQPSHSGQHGGDPEGHKHLVKHHSDGHHNKHHKDKMHDHKKSSRLHHKK